MFNHAKNKLVRKLSLDEDTTTVVTTSELLILINFEITTSQNNTQFEKIRPR